MRANMWKDIKSMVRFSMKKDRGMRRGGLTALSALTRLGDAAKVKEYESQICNLTFKLQIIKKSTLEHAFTLSALNNNMLVVSNL